VVVVEDLSHVTCGTPDVCKKLFTWFVIRYDLWSNKFFSWNSSEKEVWYL